MKCNLRQTGYGGANTGASTFMTGKFSLDSIFNGALVVLAVALTIGGAAQESLAVGHEAVVEFASSIHALRLPVARHEALPASASQCWNAPRHYSAAFRRSDTHFSA